MTPRSTQTAVRMGESATSARPGDMLSCIGIGSCIALLMVDARRGVVGLTHVVMPQGAGNPPAKFAHTAVPELIARTVATGAIRGRLRAAIVGGAAMFTFTGPPEQQIGARNEHVVRAQLELERIPLVAAETGGNAGRTLNVLVGDPVVATVRTRGSAELPLTLDTAVGEARESTPSGGEQAHSLKLVNYKTTSEVAN
jgi:chemotaxis protein CheD